MKRISTASLRPLVVTAVVLWPSVMLVQQQEAQPQTQTFGVKDVGFEGVEKKGASYGSWYVAGCKCELVPEGRSGNALRVDSGWLRQELGTIEEGQAGQPVTIQLHLKGNGEVNFFFDYADEAGKGTHRTWQERQTFFPLTTDYMLYTYTSKIPERTRRIAVNLGTGRNGGRFWVDDVSVTIGPPPAQAAFDPGPEIPRTVQLVNIAPFANIRTSPYGTLAWRMADNDETLGTGLLLETAHDGRAGTYEFQYGKPQAVAAVRYCFPMPNYALRADADGDGKYERTLTMVSGGKALSYWAGREWVEKRFWPPIEVYGIELVNFGEARPVFDFQILSPADKASFQLTQLHPRPEPGVPEVRPGAALQVPGPAPGQHLIHGFHIEPWMFNCAQWIEMKPRPLLREYKPFTDLVQDLKRMHGNLVWIFPPRTFGPTRGPGVYPTDVLWPSKFEVYSSPVNYLKEICDAFHKEGLAVFIMDREPIWKNWQEGSKANPGPVISNFYRDTMAGVVTEEVEAGVDGVSVCNDEQYWKEACYPGQANEVTRKAFREKYGLAVPERPADTEAFRKWCLFVYEQVGSCLNQAALAAKKANPKAYTTTDITVCEACFNDRVDWGVAYDVVGHQADIDYFGTDPYHTQEDGNLGHYNCAAFTKRLIAGNKRRQSIVTLNCPWADDPVKHPGFYLHFPPVSMYGPPVSSIMHGGQACAYWRYNYTFYGGYDKYVEKVYSLVETLESWGVKNAHVPHDVAVLKSRASEDWWQLKVRHGENAFDKSDQDRGFVYEKWLMELLFMNGYPFEMLYLDQPQDLANLSKYRLVILPFPYSMSQAAFANLSRAVKAGTKAVAFDRQGETDEYGTPYAKPLLADLIASGKITFVRDDLPTCGHYPQFLTSVRKTIDNLLGDRKPLYLNHYGNDVEAGCLEKKGNEKFLFVINWTNHPVTIDLGVRMPAGPGAKYRLLQRDLEAARQVTLGGRDYFTSKDLSKFRLTLEKGGLRVFYVAPYAGGIVGRRG